MKNDETYAELPGGLSGLKMTYRRKYNLSARVVELRSRTDHPHWKEFVQEIASGPHKRPGQQA